MPAKPKYSKAVKLRARAYLNFVNNRTEPVEETSRDISAIVHHPGLLESVGDEADDERPYALEDEESYFIGFGPSEDDSSNPEPGDLQESSNGYETHDFFGNATISQSQSIPRSTTPEGNPTGHVAHDLFGALALPRSKMRKLEDVAGPEIFKSDHGAGKKPFDTESINHRASSQRPRLGAYAEAFNTTPCSRCCDRLLRCICLARTNPEHVEYRDKEMDHYPEEDEDKNKDIKMAPGACAMHERKNHKGVERESRNKRSVVYYPGDETASNRPLSRLRTWAGLESEDSRERNVRPSVNENMPLTHRPRTERIQDHAQAASVPLPEDSVSSLNTNPYPKTETPNIMPNSSAVRPARMDEHARDTSESSSTAAPDRPAGLVPATSSENDAMSDIELNGTSQGQNLDEDDWVTISSELKFEVDSTSGANIPNHGPRWMCLPPQLTLLQLGLQGLESLRSIGGIIERCQTRQERTEEARGQERAANGEPVEVVESWEDVPETEAR